MPRLLLVDDEAIVTQVCRETFEALGYEVMEVNDPTLAFAAALQFRPDAVVLDFKMPVVSGADLAWQFASSPVLRKMPMIIYTGFPEAATRCQLPPCTIKIVGKPAIGAELTEAIGTALQELAVGH
jgi:CheY-like chemotaxis protein